MPGTIFIGPTSLSINLLDETTGTELTLTIYAYHDDTFRVVIDEADESRYHLEGVLDGEPEPAKYDLKPVAMKKLS